MFKTKNWIALLILYGVAVTVASAVPIAMHFTASGFPISNGNNAPNDPVTGTIVWDAASPGANINSITSITLTLDGHTYSVPEIGFVNLNQNGYIGGLINGVLGVGFLTNDFYIMWDQSTLRPRGFGYASSAVSGVWETSHFDSFIIAAAPQQTMPVPTISEWGLLLLSTLLCLTTGAMMCRQRL